MQDPHGAVKAVVILQPVKHGSRVGLLLIKRGTSPGLNEWALPGGNVEGQEYWKHAGMRELFEETGVFQPYRRFKPYARKETPGGAVIFALVPEIAGMPHFLYNSEIRGRKVVTQPMHSSFPAQIQVMQRFFGGQPMNEANERSWADDLIAQIRQRMRTPAKINRLVLQTLKSKWSEDDLIAVIDAITRARLPLSRGPLLQLYEFVKSKSPWVASAATLALLTSGGKELAEFAIEYPEDVPHHDLVFQILVAYRGHRRYRAKSGPA